MRPAIIALAVASLLPLSASCASEGEPITPAADEQQAAPQTLPEAAPEPPPAPKKCAPSCTTDADCQSTCPAPSVGTACCDMASGMCFSHNQSTCPAPTDPEQTPSY